MENIRFIRGRADLPLARAPRTYTAISANGDAVTFAVSKRMRQVLEALRNGPIFCASPVRLSAAILELRQTIGEEAIATDWFETDKGGEKSRFGAYRLVWKVKGGTQ